VVSKVLDGWIIPGLDYPSFRLVLVAKVMDRLTMRQFDGIDELTYPEWRVLCRLYLSIDGSTVRQLAGQAWVDRAEVSRAVAGLEKRGLSDRRANPRDRRMPILFLTAAGRALYEPLIEARHRFHEGILSALSAREKDTLDVLLKKMVDRLLVMSASPTLPILSTGARRGPRKRRS
jgi:DNA-binding MarR family transcriptional regulator